MNWDDIYNRVADGPWVPDPAQIYSQKKKKKAEEESDRDSFASEIINVRESIIQSGKGNEKNRLNDWSFMDESALTSAAGGHGHAAKSRF